ncbi:MAG: hypothetical protein R3B47_08750 [Bacteroidia bacterium]
MNRLNTIILLLSGLIVSLCHGQNFVFAHGIENTSDQGGRAVATDPLTRAVVVTGYHYGTMDFDPSAGVSTRASAGGADVFIAKYDSAGNLLWATDFGGSLNEYPSDVGLSLYGDIYVCGSFNGTVDFDPGAASVQRTSRGGTDAFLVKFDGNGVFQWVVTFGGASTTNALDGADGLVVGLNEVYLVGSFEGSFIDVNPNGTPYYQHSSGDQNMFLIKYTAYGDHI